jgi:hypothetical protein
MAVGDLGFFDGLRVVGCVKQHNLEEAPVAMPVDAAPAAHSLHTFNHYHPDTLPIRKPGLTPTLRAVRSLVETKGKVVGTAGKIAASFPVGWLQPTTA